MATTKPDGAKKQQQIDKIIQHFEICLIAFFLSIIEKTLVSVHII